MSKKDPNIIRIDDVVKIIKPNFFVRCGYPLSFKEACEIIKEKYHKEINEFINKFNFIPLYYSFSLFDNDNDEHQDTKIVKKITSALAYEYIRSKKFSGNERQIYTKEYLRYEDRLMDVIDIKFVKTGVYVSGTPYVPYESEGEEAHLIEQKTHKLIHVCSNEPVLFFKKDMNKHEFTVETCSNWIEVTNVEKIQKD